MLDGVDVVVVHRGPGCGIIRLSDHFSMSDPQCSRNDLNSSKFQIYIFLIVRDDKIELASSVWVKEAGGFFCQQGALVSGVSVCLQLHPGGRSGMGRRPPYLSNLCKKYKIVSTTGTDKYN